MHQCGDSMDTISKLGKEDYAKYKTILTAFGIVSGEEIDDGYKINMSGREYVLFPFGPLYMVYYEENGVVKNSIIQTDNEGKIVSFTFNGKQIAINGKGIVLIDEDHNQEGLHYRSNKSIDLNTTSNNGIVYYTQYHSKDDMMLELRYEHNLIGSGGELFPYHTNDPFYVGFRQHASKYKFLNVGKRYYRVDFDARDSKFLYDLATLREYGIVDVFTRGTIALHGSYTFTKYYRELMSFGEYTSLLSFPFSKGLDEEDIDDLIDKGGFRKSVPDSLLNLYNNAPRIVRNRQDLIDMYSYYVREEEKVRGI